MVSARQPGSRQRIGCGLCIALGLILWQGVVVVGSCAEAAPPAGVRQPRPDKWAQPVGLSGVPNLHKVSDQLYRSAQPTKEGMQALKALGIRTVVNLRSFHTDRGELEGSGLEAVHITMKAWHPEEKEIAQFLRLVTDPTKTPILVHCQHGADRTGALSAVYRIAVQGWSTRDALQEMTEGGYGFHDVWVNLTPWINALDMDRIRRQAGLK